jgi:hypothetical protein
MNEQLTLDKAGTPRRLNNMNNETGSIYGLLVHSEEKGRGRMEAAVFATCILSVVVAIIQFVGQPTPDPFAGFESPAQTAPILSHHSVEATLDTKS